jgi:hypothetical protein
MKEIADISTGEELGVNLGLALEKGHEKYKFYE